MPMTNAGEYKYRAFISYSHQDNVARRAGDAENSPQRIAWGDWLHGALETYRVPRPFVGRPGRFGERVPARLVPCFQDEKELPTEASLQGAIEEGLRASRYLIVLCSPRSARSIYVNAEVLYFKKLGRADRILPVIIDGEPNASLSVHKRGFPADAECFCPALKHAVGEDGTLDTRTTQEPLCADVRWGDEKREIAVADQRLARPTMEHAKLKLLAGLLGVGFDDLFQRERQRQIRIRRQQAAAVITIMTVILGLAAVAWWQRGAANQQRNVATEQRQVAEREALRAQTSEREARLRLADNYFTKGLECLKAGKLPDAAAYLVGALRFDSSHYDAKSMLVSLLQFKAPPPLCYRPMDMGSAATRLTFARDGSTLLGTGDAGTIGLWDVLSGKLKWRFSQGSGPLRAAEIDPAGERILTIGANGIPQLRKMTTGQELALPRMAENLSGAAFAPDGNRLAVWDSKALKIWILDLPDLAIWDASALKASRILDLPDQPSLLLDAHPTDLPDGGIFAVVFSPDGRWLAVAGNDGVHLWNTSSWQESGHPFWSFAVRYLLWDEKSRFLVGVEEKFLPVDNSPTGGAAESTIAARWIGDAATSVAESFSGKVKALQWNGVDLLAASGNDDYDDGAWHFFSQPLASEKQWAEQEHRDFPTSLLAVGFNPSAGFGVMTTADGRVVREDFSNDRLNEAAEIRLSSPAAALAVSPCGRYFATATPDGLVQVWDALLPGPLIDAIPLPPEQNHSGPPSFEIEISSQNQAVHVSIDSDEVASVRATGDEFPLRSIPNCSTAAFSRAGDLLLLGKDDGRVQLYDPRTEKILSEARPHRHRISSTTLSPDGQRMVTTSDDGTFRLLATDPWQMLSEQIPLPTEREGGMGESAGARFSKNGNEFLV